MTTEHQRQVRKIFDAASSVAEDKLTDFVRHQAAGNPEIVEAVLRLVRASRSSGDFLNKPLIPPGRTSMRARPGTRIGPYRIMREIGSGGMGVVYLAVRDDDAFRRIVALKVIRAEYNSPQMIERFRQERQILATLDHPNIARILDGGTTDAGLPYFAMDYVDGIPIDAFCNQRNAPFEQRLNLFRQSCQAVQYLHEHRIVHRDLKPANMLVSTGGTVKLLDFGIAKLFGEGSEMQMATAPLVTLEYASPEQVSGKHAGERSDIYSLGVILYELVTGRRPHEADGRSVPEKIAAITAGHIRRPSDLVGSSSVLRSAESASQMRGHLRGDLDCILLMALRQEPQGRYASAAAFGADIENYHNRRPVAARKGATLYVVSRYTRRNRTRIAASFLLGASLSWAGWNEVRVLRLQAIMNQPAKIERLPLEQASGTTPSGTEQHAGTQSLASIDHNLKTLRQNYQTTFPQLLESPLTSKTQNAKFVERDLSWLDQIAPSTQRQPDLALEVARTYYDLARAQWNNQGPSLNDAPAANATARKIFDLLQKTPSTPDDSAAIHYLADEINRYAGMLPSVAP